MLYEFNEKVLAFERQGKKIVKLNVGQPDWRPPIDVIEEAFFQLKNGRDRYSTAWGEESLRQKIAELHQCDAENVVMFPGSKQAIYSILATQANAGDEIAFFTPYWTAYEKMCEQLKLRVKKIPLTQEQKFQPSSELLSSHLTKKTKLIILNSPNNPSSIAFTEKQEKQIQQIARENKSLLITDDAYRDLCFDARTSRQYEEGIAITQTFSKTFGMAGWRVGYCIASKEIAARLVSLNQITFSNVPVFLQLAAVKALEHRREVVDRVRKISLERWQKAEKLLPNLEIASPNAGFCVFPKLKNNSDATNFCFNLLEQGVAVTPGKAFGNYAGNFRISLTAPDEQLTESLKKINDLSKNYSSSQYY